jgi:hypothetical protein
MQEEDSRKMLLWNKPAAAGIQERGACMPRSEGLIWITIIASMVEGVLWAAPPPPPGTLNSFTGDVSINGSSVGMRDVGHLALETGFSISTAEGMAELLLMTGGLLRLGSNSLLTREKSDLPQLHLRLGRGEVLVEVLNLAAPIILEQSRVTVSIRQPGLYGFEERRPFLLVYAGEAQIIEKGKQTVARSGFGTSSRRAHGNSAADNLVAWSKLRSRQLSAESAVSAQGYPASDAGLPAPVWSWDPWAESYTYLSASGAVVGPFGWPYYSPGYAPNAIIHAVLPSGDSRLYGPPVLSTPGYVPGAPETSPTPSSPSRVPLTAPGEPQFPTGK